MSKTRLDGVAGLNIHQETDGGIDAVLDFLAKYKSADILILSWNNMFVKNICVF